MTVVDFPQPPQADPIACAECNSGKFFVYEDKHFRCSNCGFAYDWDSVFGSPPGGEEQFEISFQPDQEVIDELN